MINQSTSTRPQDYGVQFEYFFPMETAMKGIDATADQVADWLKTGAGANREVALEDSFGKRCLAIKQSYTNDKSLYDEVTAMIAAAKPRKP